MCIVLALEARRGPNTQDQAGRLMEATGHHFEEVTTSYHPPEIAREVAGKSSHTSGPSDSSGRNKVWNFTRSGDGIVVPGVGGAFGFLHVHMEPKSLCAVLHVSGFLSSLR